MSDPSRAVRDDLSQPEIRRKRLQQLSGFVPEDQGPPEILRLDYEPAPLWVYGTSRVEKRSRALSCAKEPWTVAWLQDVLRPGDVLYDIGANVGAYSLVAADLVGETGRVVAFEPGYASFAHLCDNVFLNGFESRIIPVPLPVGASTRLGAFHYQRLYPGHARHMLGGAHGEDPTKITFRQQALGARLDDLHAWFALPQPHHIKIDVDGTELDVMSGGAALFDSPSLRSVFLEVEEPHTDAVLAFLSTRGFKLMDRFQRERDGTPVGWWFGRFERS